LTLNAQLTVKLSVFSRLQSLINQSSGFCRTNAPREHVIPRAIPSKDMDQHASSAKKPATDEGGAPSILEIRVKQGDSVSAELLQ
jgi:hypothetical protein